MHLREAQPVASRTAAAPGTRTRPPGIPLSCRAYKEDQQAGALWKGSSDEPWTPFLWASGKAAQKSQRGRATHQAAGSRPCPVTEFLSPRWRWGRRLERGDFRVLDYGWEDCCTLNSPPVTVIDSYCGAPLPCHQGRGLSTCGSWP